MALDRDELNAVTRDWIDKRPSDIHFTGAVLLFMMLKMGKIINGGVNLSAVLEYDESNKGTYGHTTTIQTTQKELFNTARFRWAGYYSSSTIGLKDKRENNGDAADLDLVLGKLNNQAKTIRNQMGDGIYATGTANGDAFLGLGNLFNTTTSTTYGGIAEDDMSNWGAKVITSPGAMTFKLMQRIRRTAQISNDPEGIPNLYITTPLLKDAYERTLQSGVRYSDKMLANAGFDNVLFGRKPVVSDMKHTATYVSALNLPFLDIKTHSLFNFTKPVWEHEVTKPDVETSNTRWSGQLVCRNRKAQCQAQGVTDPS